MMILEWLPKGGHSFLVTTDMKHPNQFVCLFVLILYFFRSHAFSQTRGDDILKTFFQENNKIESIDCTIEQIISEHSVIEKYKGRYRCDNKGRFRIDYREPSNQTVIATEKNLLWHMPDVNILYVIKNTESINGNMPIMHSPKHPLPIQQFNNVAYLGVWPVGIFTLAHHVVLINPKNGLKFEIAFSIQNYNILHKRIVDRDGREIIKEIYSDYKQIGSAFFPRRVDVFAKTKLGYVRSISLYSDIQINTKIPDEVFVMRVPKKTRVMSLGAH